MSHLLFKNLSIVATFQPQTHRKIKYFSLDKVLVYCEKKMASPGDVSDLYPSP